MRRQAAPGIPLKGLARTPLLRSNLKTIGYLVVAAFNSAARMLRFQDNIIRNPTMTDIRSLAIWLRSLAGLLALAGALALSGCGGGGASGFGPRG